MIHIKYKPNHISFAKLMMSDQTQNLADQAADRGVQVARGIAAGMSLPEEYIASIKATRGPIVVLGGNPRRTARLVSKYPYIEFGSGRKRPRPQGGRSPAYRVLGRTLPRIGSYPYGEAGGPT